MTSSNYLIEIFCGVYIAASAMGCGPSIETSPERILPVLKQAQRCCDSRCGGAYEGISQGVACADVIQLESCLSGNREQCPVKGYGSF